MKNHRRIDSLSNPWLAVAVIAVFGLVIYSNTYRAPFVFDDLQRIEENVKIRDLSECLSPKQLFSPRPVAELTFALNYRFGGLNVFGYHIVNVLIHIINGTLVYFLALTIFRQLLVFPVQNGGYSDRHPNLGIHKVAPKTSEGVFSNSQSKIDNRQSTIFLMSLFAALIFIAHPLQTQAITYIIQRHASLAATFYFLSVFFYMRARILQQDAGGSGLMAVDSGQWSVVSGQEGGDRQGSVGKNAFTFRLSACFALVFLCGVLAFLSKQNTASLPGAILLVEYILFDRTWQGWKKKLVWFIPFCLLLGIFILFVSGIFRQGVQFGSLLEDVSSILRAPETYVGRWTYFCTQLNVIVIYLRLLVLPVGQNLDYMYPFKAGFFYGYTPAAFLLLMAVAGVGIWQIRKRPAISFGVFWIFIALSVESSVFPIKDALFEHRLYLPMFGFAIAVSYAVFCLLPIKRRWRIVISVFMVCSLGTAAFLRNRVYRSNTVLWSDVAAKSPRNFRAHFNLGKSLDDEGRLREAIESYRRSLSIRPEWDKAHVNLGIALRRSGRVDEAIRYFSKRLALSPHNPEMHCNLGVALMQQGNLEEANRHFSEALRIRPDFAEAHNNLGTVSARQGNLKAAAGHFSEALRIEPRNARIHSNLGQALMLQGDLQGAVRHFSEAVRIEPGYAEAHSKLGLVLVRQGDIDGGIEHFSTALRLNPELSEARQGMKWAQGMKGGRGVK